MQTNLKTTNHSPQGREIIPQQQIIGLLQSNDPFPIDFDLAWKWCNYSRKDAAKRILTSNFTQTIDYQILHRNVEQGKIGGINKETIKLSIDCFKAFSMMAGTEKGKEIRAYFISCEKELLSLKNQSKEEILIKKQITGRIKLLRKKNQFTQTDMGNLIGMSISGVSAKEQFVSAYSVLEIKKIKTRFNTTYDYLIDGDEQKISPEGVVDSGKFLSLQEKHLLIQEKVILLQERLINTLEIKPAESPESSEKYCTVLAFAIKNKVAIDKKQATKLGIKASSLCRERNIEIKKVSSEAYGEIGSYPVSILKEVFNSKN